MGNKCMSVRNRFNGLWIFLQQGIRIRRVENKKRGPLKSPWRKEKCFYFTTLLLLLINYKIYVQFACPEIVLIFSEFKPFCLKTYAGIAKNETKFLF
jgi:hypothetical protein